MFLEKPVPVPGNLRQNLPKAIGLRHKTICGRHLVLIVAVRAPGKSASSKTHQALN